MTAIEHLQRKLYKIAIKLETEAISYSVVSAKRDGRYDEDGSCEEYCGKCIDAAVKKARNKYRIEREKGLAQIEELRTNGFIKEGRKKQYPEKDFDFKKWERQHRKRYCKRTFKSEGTHISGSETDSFRSCNTCNKMFEYSILPNDQELEYWESLTKKNYLECFKEPRNAYELNKILDGVWDDEYKERIEALAHKIKKYLSTVPKERK
jgi:hypothetical protein